MFGILLGLCRVDLFVIKGFVKVIFEIVVICVEFFFCELLYYVCVVVGCC